MKSSACSNELHPFVMKPCLEGFLDRIQQDPRPQKTHKAMLLGLLCSWVGSGFASSFQITRRKLMSHAGVKGIGTYHKHLSDLVQWNYLVYEPSYHPGKGSRVSLIY